MLRSVPSGPAATAPATVHVVSTAHALPGGRLGAPRGPPLVDAISRVPLDRWDAAGDGWGAASLGGSLDAQFGGFLAGVEEFDPEMYGMAAGEALLADPQQRLVLDGFAEALQALGAGVPSGGGVGVYVGVSQVRITPKFP